MSDPRTPGVYVEEVVTAVRSIAGVPTGTPVFVGPTRTGPALDPAAAPAQLRSFGDFERLHGGLDDLVLGGVARPNYLAHAALGFFREGGTRLYVARTVGQGAVASGVAVGPDAGAEAAVRFEARYVGRAGDGSIEVGEVLTTANRDALDGAPPGTLVRTGPTATPLHHVKDEGRWVSLDTDGDPSTSEALADSDARIITLLVVSRDVRGGESTWGDLGFDPRHPRAASRILGPSPSGGAGPFEPWFALSIGPDVDALSLCEALFDDAEVSAAGRRHRVWTLEGGEDGSVPLANDYELALAPARDVRDIALVAAPGSTTVGDTGQALAIANVLVAHAEMPGAHRFVVLDAPPDASVTEVRDYRARLDSRHAALYYPWIVTVNPNARPGRDDIPADIAMPPSGYLCGIYARTDSTRGVHKAPANETVRSAIDLEHDVDEAEQEVLNPAAINCLRFFPGRGFRVWGARVLTSDAEWKYVAVRRFATYLEASIDRGTEWAVFEPNGPSLWSEVRRVIEDFLHACWRGGALQGTKPEEAFFVRCDRTTMTQTDLDEGRLICQIGVAVVKPAEFVIFRIGQKTSPVPSATTPESALVTRKRPRRR